MGSPPPDNSDLTLAEVESRLRPGLRSPSTPATAVCTVPQRSGRARPRTIPMDGPFVNQASEFDGGRRVMQAGGNPQKWDLGTWPRLMRAEQAAAYVGEKSIQAFRCSVGKLYPKPLKVAGKGDRWLKEHLDGTIDRLARNARVADIADPL